MIWHWPSLIFYQTNEHSRKPRSRFGWSISPSLWMRVWIDAHKFLYVRTSLSSRVRNKLYVWAMAIFWPEISWEKVIFQGRSSTHSHVFMRDNQPWTIDVRNGQPQFRSMFIYRGISCWWITGENLECSAIEGWWSKIKGTMSAQNRPLLEVVNVW